MSPQHVLRGERRTYYSTHLIVLCIALTLFISGGIGAVVSLLVAGSTTHSISQARYREEITLCEHQNQTRRELNRRIQAHESDARDLGALTRLVAQILHGVPALRAQAAVADDILRQQRRITFKALAPISCRSHRVITAP